MVVGSKKLEKVTTPSQWKSFRGVNLLLAQKKQKKTNSTLKISVLLVFGRTS